MRHIVILGGGPAGLTAAIYAARANLAPLVVEGAEAGGQLMLTTLVENYPGFEDGIMGPALMQAMRKQAERVGVEFITEDAVAVNFRQRPFEITTQSGHRLEARAVIVATGASARLLGIPGEQRFMGRGVSTCATCDGFFFRNRDVIVVGGGDSALEEALYLANLAKSVTVVHRRDRLRASKIMQQRAFAHARIGFIWDTVVEDILGDGVVSGVRLMNLKTQERRERPVDGVFVAIGHIPNTALFKGQLELDEQGYIRLRERSHTSIEGVFAAGDVHDHTYRQAVTAAGFGCMAAMDAERWLQGQEP
ncbi:MAG: thioredoxin-disulfide reductase [Armatimonadota bacterium]|nr:thioredoxin-disulfide reductase [Armatimonadota bacterium]MDR7548987.1 thioredoxin-disulfide reductase [Armatimonadota bacterium]